MNITKNKAEGSQKRQCSWREVGREQRFGPEEEWADGGRFG